MHAIKISLAYCKQTVTEISASFLTLLFIHSFIYLFIYLFYLTQSRSQSLSRIGQRFVAGRYSDGAMEFLTYIGCYMKSQSKIDIYMHSPGSHWRPYRANHHDPRAMSAGISVYSCQGPPCRTGRRVENAGGLEVGRWANNPLQ